MKLILPLASYNHRAKQLSSRRLVNCYPEQVPLPGKAPVALLRSPGIEDWITLPTSPVRGSLMHNGTLYVVSGVRLYSVLDDGTYTDLGKIKGSGLVSMDTNGVELVIVSKPNGWIYDTDGLAQITDPDFTVRGASDVACIDSFMVYVEPDSGRAFASEFLDAGNVEPLSFATAEGEPDNLVAVIVDHRQIFMFGVDSTEIWYNSGATPFPFLREQNGFLEVGCAAKNSPAKADNTVFWLDNNRIARRLVDLTPARISTHAIEQTWQDYTTVWDAYSMSYIQDGHTMWALTFPSEGATWEFDIATNEWHERSSRLSNGAESHWRVTTCTWAYGNNVVGDGRSGKLGRLKANSYTEWNDLQRMSWRYPSVYGEGRKAFHKRLQIMFQHGVGLTTGQGSDPQVMLYASDDGGVTFDALPSRGFGKIGEYQDRALWTRLGSSYDRVYEAAVSDPVPVTVIDTQLEVEGGRL